MDNRRSVREELAGKTEMSPDNENDLFARLETIERDGAIAAPLAKGDWAGILATFLALGIFPLFFYAVKLI